VKENTFEKKFYFLSEYLETTDNEINAKILTQIFLEYLKRISTFSGFSQ